MNGTPHIWIPNREIIPPPPPKPLFPARRQVERASCMPAAIMTQRLPLKPMNAVTPIDQIDGANFIAWYRPLASTMFTTIAGSTNVSSDGDTIGRWEDQIGIYNMLARADDTTRPVYKVNIQNSLPSPLFTKASSQLLTEGVQGLGLFMNGDDTPLTLACFAKQVSTTGVQNFFSTGTGFDSDSWGLRTWDGSGDYEFRRSDGTTAGIAGGGTPDTAAAWFVWVDHGTTVDLWKNGTQILSGVSYSPAVGDVNAGTYASMGGHIGTSIANFFDGYIGEMGIWDVALSAGDVDLANAYGQATWATW